MIELRPQPGPQEAFLCTPADIAFYGGAAGSGKSWAEVLDVTRYAYVPRFSAVYFRRTFPQLSAPDGLWDVSLGILPHCGAEPHHGDMEWTLPAGGRVIMRHLQHEKDKYNHQGPQYCGIYFDELTQFTAGQFWYLLSRNRSMCGVPPFVRGTCNPDPDSFVADLIEWWLDDNGDPIPERSGVLRWFVRSGSGDAITWADSRDELVTKHGQEPLSFTFISAKLDDNPALLKRDPGYRSRLMALHYVERARLLGGNWKVRPAAGNYFKRHWFPVFDSMPGTPVATVRGWDKAATEVSETNRDPDWTRGVKMHRLRNAPVDYLISDVVGDRLSPGGVDDLIRNTASQDGKAVTQAFFVDPGQAGKVDQAHMRDILRGYRMTFERASQSKTTYAGPVSSQAEGQRIGLLRAPWNDAYLAEVEAFPDGRHDDIVDGQSIAFMKLHRMSGARVAPAGAGGGNSRWRV